MIKRFYSFQLFKPILHIFVIIISFFLVYKLRLITDLIPFIQLPIPRIDYEETMLFAIISAIVFAIIGILRKVYVLDGIQQKYFIKFSRTRLYWLIFITFISYFGAGFIFEYAISRFIIIFGAIISFVLLLFVDQIRLGMEKLFHQKLQTKVLIIGKLNMNTDVLNGIKKTFGMMTEFVQIDEFNSIDLKDYHAIIALGEFSKDKLQGIFESIRFHETRFFHISDSMFLEDVAYKPEYIAQTIAIEYTHSRLDGRSRVFKRLFDIIGSVIGILLLSPLLLILAIMIKLDSKGLILFVQKRIGKGEKPFTFLKFRSMYTHLSTGEKYGGAEATKIYEKLKNSSANTRKGGPLAKIKDDPRITKIGTFLRKSSLDELPQLFCVLIGTMSLIGPRPHLPKEVEKYTLRQKRLLSIKPGITGYAQVFGRDNLAFDEEAKLDLYYIQNRSLFMDIYIIYMTFKVIFKGK